MKEIVLTQGQVTLVDDEDFEFLSQWKWCAHRMGKGSSYVYAVRRDQRTVLHMHRQIMQAGRGQIVDHINGNTLDNRRSNLRIATHQQNMMNHKPYGPNAFTGVRKHSSTNNPFTARIQFNKQRIHLGSFSTPEAAAQAYDLKAKELFGEFARLNFPAKEGHAGETAILTRSRAGRIARNQTARLLGRQDERGRHLTRI